MAIYTDMPKARLIQLDRIRVARDLELIVKDKELMIDEEQSLGFAVTIKADKQALRDLPVTVQPALDAATDEASLKLVDGGLTLV